MKNSSHSAIGVLGSAVGFILATVASVPMFTLGDVSIGNFANAKVAQELPAKKSSKKKTTRIELAPNEAVVVAPRNPKLNAAIQKSETERRASERRTQEVEIKSRIVVPAPPGDQSELAGTPTRVNPNPAPQPKVITTTVSSPENESAQTNSISANPHYRIEILNVDDLPPAIPPGAIVISDSISNTISETSAKSNTVSAKNEESNLAAAQDQAALENSKMVFIRTGYLHANYKKFDARMKNGATSIGLGAAHGFQTDWGEFEARASFDVYHAMDQSVSVDNVRMFATRTEVAYWLTKSRVRPALTLGLGWTDYAVRSYRAVAAAAGGEIVTLRTHAKSQAFSVIPGTALRIQINDQIAIDSQTEFFGILGGESADAVQGLAFSLNLGWMF